MVFRHFLVIFISFSSVCSDQYTNTGNDERLCTNDTSGLPRSDFDKALCGFYNSPADNGGLRWERAHHMVGDSSFNLSSLQNPSDKQSKKGCFMYVDMTSDNITVGSKARLVGGITSGYVKAICITLQYSTVSDGDAPTITVYNRKEEGQGGRVMEGVIGTVRNNTVGQWVHADFQACVWNRSQIVFEAEKTNVSSIVAIHWITMTHSNSWCNCMNRYNGTPGCHFNKNWCGTFGDADNTKGNNDGWERVQNVSCGTEGNVIERDSPYRPNRKKGYFVIPEVKSLKSGTSPALKGEILGNFFSKVCIIFDYATIGNETQRIRISNELESGSDVRRNFIGEVSDMTHGEWKTIRFIAQVMPNYENIQSRVVFEIDSLSHTGLVALDNIRVSERDPNKQTTTITTTIRTTSAPTVTTMIPTVVSPPRQGNSEKTVLIPKSYWIAIGLGILVISIALMVAFVIFLRRRREPLDQPKSDDDTPVKNEKNEVNGRTDSIVFVNGAMGLSCDDTHGRERSTKPFVLNQGEMGHLADNILKNTSDATVVNPEDETNVYMEMAGNQPVYINTGSTEPISNDTDVKTEEETNIYMEIGDSKPLYDNRGLMKSITDDNDLKTEEGTNNMYMEIGSCKPLYFENGAMER